MEFITVLKEALAGHIEQFLEGWNGNCEAESLSSMEQAVQKLTQAMGQQVLSGWLERQEARYARLKSACGCGEQAAYVRRREAVSLTLHGKVAYRRAYYVCGCGQGHSPLDDRLGIAPGQMSTEVKTLAALFGVQEAFVSSSATLARLLPLELSPNSIRSDCQQAGEAVNRPRSRATRGCPGLAAADRDPAPAGCTEADVCVPGRLSSTV